MKNRNRLIVSAMMCAVLLCAAACMLPNAEVRPAQLAVNLPPAAQTASLYRGAVSSHASPARSVSVRAAENDAEGMAAGWFELTAENGSETVTFEISEKTITEGNITKDGMLLFELRPGEWTVTLDMYAEYEGRSIRVASGSADTELEAGKVTAVTIVMRIVMSGFYEPTVWVESWAELKNVIENGTDKIIELRGPTWTLDAARDETIMVSRPGIVLIPDEGGVTINAAAFPTGSGKALFEVQGPSIAGSGGGSTSSVDFLLGVPTEQEMLMSTQPGTLTIDGGSAEHPAIIVRSGVAGIGSGVELSQIAENSVVVYQTGAFFVMGGTITDCGIGIAVVGGTATLQGGSIENNTTWGVSVTSSTSGGSFSMTAGTISGNGTGGVNVANSCYFAMMGGTIYGADGGENANPISVRNGTSQPITFPGGSIPIGDYTSTISLAPIGGDGFGGSGDELP